MVAVNHNIEEKDKLYKNFFHRMGGIIELLGSIVIIIGKLKIGLFQMVRFCNIEICRTRCMTVDNCEL